MKIMLLTLMAFSAAAFGQDPKPVWELGKDPIDPKQTDGQIDIVDGAVSLNGTNSFSLPAGVLGAQNDYTIEFEVKRDPDAALPNDRLITLMSNISEADKAGLGLAYAPPSWGAGLIFINDGQIQQGTFLPEGNRFYKLSFVVKDKKLQLFRDGLLLATTDTVKTSPLPLVFGGKKDKPVKPYELRHLKIYNSAIFPTGFDRSAEQMRFCVGDQYAMQRVDVKDPTLPRILVIGDSISMGYRPYITEHFKGKAYVDYWVGGGWLNPKEFDEQDPKIERAFKGVLSQGPYDVVSWNSMTLHMWEPHQPGRCPEGSIVSNFTHMVAFLKKTAPNTKFIWIRCTPWRAIQPDGTQTLEGPFNQRMVTYNGIVDTVMRKEGIPEVDLYAIAEKQMHTLPKGWKDCLHWGPEVSKLFADAIIKEIVTQLGTKAK